MWWSRLPGDLRYFLPTGKEIRPGCNATKKNLQIGICMYSIILTLAFPSSLPFHLQFFVLHAPPCRRPWTPPAASASSAHIAAAPVFFFLRPVARRLVGLLFWDRCLVVLLGRKGLRRRLCCPVVPLPPCYWSWAQSCSLVLGLRTDHWITCRLMSSYGSIMPSTVHLVGPENASSNTATLHMISSLLKKKNMISSHPKEKRDRRQYTA